MSEKTLATYDEMFRKVRSYKRHFALCKIAQLSCHLETTGQYICEIPFENKRPDRISVIVTQDALPFISSLFAYTQMMIGIIFLLMMNYFFYVTGTLIWSIRSQNHNLSFLLGFLKSSFVSGLGKYSFAQSYYLMQTVSKRSGFTAPIDVEASFFDWLGLSIDDYYWLSWCIFSPVYSTKPAFTSGYFLSHNIDAFKEVLAPREA